MQRAKPMFLFLGLTLGIFLVLLLFGPKKMYAGFYRSTGNLLFSHCGHQRIAQFTPYVDEHGPKDTRLEIGRIGKGYMAKMPINSKRLAYIPTVLLLALVLATPIGWKQKGIALAVSMVILQCLIQVALGFSLAEGFMAVTADGKRLLSLPEFLDWTVGRIDQFLSGDMNTTFIMPVVVWILVMGRRWDFKTLLVLPEDEK